MSLTPIYFFNEQLKESIKEGDEKKIENQIRGSRDLKDFLKWANCNPNWTANHECFVRYQIKRYVNDCPDESTRIINQISLTILSPVLMELSKKAADHTLAHSDIAIRCQSFTKHTMPLLLLALPCHKQHVRKIAVKCVGKLVEDRTLFHQAAYQGSPKDLRGMLRLLPKNMRKQLLHPDLVLHKPVDNNKHTKTAIQQAVLGRNIDTFKYLLKKAPEQLRSKTCRGNNLVHLIAKTGENEYYLIHPIIKHLKKRDANLFYECNSQGKTPIDISIENNTIACFRGVMRGQEKYTLDERLFQENHLMVSTSQLWITPSRIKKLSEELTHEEQMELLQIPSTCTEVIGIDNRLGKNMEKIIKNSNTQIKTFSAAIRYCMETRCYTPERENYFLKPEYRTGWLNLSHYAHRIIVPNLSNRKFLQLFKHNLHNKMYVHSFPERWSDCYQYFSFATLAQKEYLVLNKVLVIEHLSGKRSAVKKLKEDLTICAQNSSKEEFLKFLDRYQELKYFLNRHLDGGVKKWKHPGSLFYIDGSSPILEEGLTHLRKQIRKLEAVYKATIEMEDTIEDLKEQYSFQEPKCVIL